MSRNPEYQHEDGSFREVAPQGYPDATASEYDDLTPLEELMVEHFRETYARLRPARMPLIRQWIAAILARLPRQQTFASAMDLTCWLRDQYRVHLRSCPTWPHHWCDEMMLREIAYETFADAAAAGRSYSSPRSAA